MKKNCVLFLFLTLSLVSFGREYHVSVKGNDANVGTEAAPFKTIGKAAQAAYAGDVITVHAGVYREWVNPPRGGESDDKRIVYCAAPGERVELKGSELVAKWQKENGIWKIVLPNSFFGDYNPYKDLIYGDWFDGRRRIHHTGEVFLNGKSLYEKETLDKVLHPVANAGVRDSIGSTYTWYCESDDQQTTIWANFHKFNPNKEQVEISARRTCFYPEKQGVNYLTIRGFHISQAATQWAAPTAEQIGMIATHWNKGWIIENNVISNAKCSGITLGKERATGHNVWLNDMSIDGSLHYIEVTFRTLRNGWNKEQIGSHIVRNNEIFACEQTGICGSMGAAFSLIENNYIHDIWTKRQFDGAEIAGIKFHAAIDTRICNNRIHHTGRGIWLDWMDQGARVSRNLLYENDVEDMLIEVSHGPCLVDNNIFGSSTSVSDWSQGSAFVHNIFAGRFGFVPGNRYTPYHLPHQTDIAGLSTIPGGDDRFINNLFLPITTEEKKLYGMVSYFGLAQYKKVVYPMQVDGNVYYNHALPFEGEAHQVVAPDFNPNFKIEEKGGEVYVSFSLQDIEKLATEQVTTERLGKAKLPRQAYEQPDGTPITIDRDYLGNARNAHPQPGPFEAVKDGSFRFKVYPNTQK
ncbi:hypothetical protein SAMD00024442_4_30 [Candidatus Symbiothrix dinenymphae]|nr:hypothetical protein SAMD00024442_4_30 [Candidatus Symbiothrix dinenymphae]